MDRFDRMNMTPDELAEKRLRQQADSKSEMEKVKKHMKQEKAILMEILDLIAKKYENSTPEKLFKKGNDMNKIASDILKALDKVAYAVQWAMNDGKEIMKKGKNVPKEFTTFDSSKGSSLMIYIIDNGNKIWSDLISYISYWDHMKKQGYISPGFFNRSKESAKIKEYNKTKIVNKISMILGEEEELDKNMIRFLDYSYRNRGKKAA